VAEAVALGTREELLATHPAGLSFGNGPGSLTAPVPGTAIFAVVRGRCERTRSVLTRQPPGSAPS